MNKQISLKHLVPVFMSFYIMGFVDLVGVATGYIKQDFNLSDSMAQLLPSMVFIWFALVSIPTGIFQDRNGKRKTVTLAMVITGIGLIIPFIHYSYATAVIGFVILGIGNTILQVSANPLLIDISSKESKAANLSLSQFVKAIASMVGPLLVAGLARYTGNWKLIFPIYAAISVLIAFWLSSVKIEESKSDKEPATLKSVLQLFKVKYIVVMILSVFFMVGFDVAINTNIANFLSTRFAINLDTASIGISVYFAALMTGRFAGAFLLRKLNVINFLIVSTIITLAGLAGIIAINNLTLSWIMIFITGLGFSNIFPIIYTIAIEKRPEYSNEISGLIILAVCGGAVIPPIMGLISDSFGVTQSLFVLVGCILYVSYSAYYASKN
ncbi:MAG: MFS transporter [Salinivirgaceae bacterium]|nr:MFS transporter [Salinivirgaceae bacterium]